LIIKKVLQLFLNGNKIKKWNIQLKIKNHFKIKLFYIFLINHLFNRLIVNSLFFHYLNICYINIYTIINN